MTDPEHDETLEVTEDEPTVEEPTAEPSTAEDPEPEDDPVDDENESLKKALKIERDKTKKLKEKVEKLTTPPVKKDDGLAGDFYQTKVDAQLARLIAIDPTARTRYQLIEEILDAHPEMKQWPNAVVAADQMAKGQLVSQTAEDKTAPVTKKTSTVQPKQPEKKPDGPDQHPDWTPSQVADWAKKQAQRNAAGV